MKIYTKRGDDGSTGMFHGGRVAKDASGPVAYGTVDEAVSALAVARAIARDDLADAILQRQRELFVVGAELATNPERRDQLKPGISLVTAEMVTKLEGAIDTIVAERGMPTEFVVPGDNPVAAAIDVARTVVRRAERDAVTHVRRVDIANTEVIRYLNRLADYLYMLARAAEDAWTRTRNEEE